MELLIPKLQFVAMPLGMEIYASGVAMPCAYFPTSSVVSLTHSTVRGSTSQVALVGHEGLVGVSIFMGGNSTSSAVVICPGMGYRIGRDALLHSFNESAPVQSLLLRYTQALIAQVSQSAVCNRHHQIDQQLCSLLLLCCDRFLSDTLYLTHEQLADMLGVRREGVAHAAKPVHATTAHPA